MCGIAGALSIKGFKDLAHLDQMRDALSHRGPDSAGSWLNTNATVYLGHRRLAILDLTEEGHQPMHSSSGRFTLVFNGEVYNFLEFREELKNKGHSFKSQSDTEVMLAAFEEWGIEKALAKFNGMFSIVVYDAKENTLTLVRDRFGVKPLYYAVTPTGLYFASELKSFKSISEISKDINRDALALHIRHAYIPAPYSIFNNVFKLQPGAFLTVKFETYEQFFKEFTPELGSKFGPKEYWSSTKEFLSARDNEWVGSEQEAIIELEKLLLDCVRLRMISDVPLGAFLSGGIDSSTVVALMQAQSNKPVRTFSIGFDVPGYNEAEFAKQVASHLGTDHTEVYLSSQAALDVIPKIPFMYDEPFGDSSQIPTYLVSSIARKHVTVSLSGDGGDELFGGYLRFHWGDAVWSKLSKLPLPIKRILSKLISTFPAGFYDGVGDTLQPLLPHQWRTRHIGDKVHRLAEILQIPSRMELYRRAVSFWDESEDFVLKSKKIKTNHEFEDERLSYPELMMLIDTTTYLTDDILTKVDRASMGVSLEAREPLLDYRLFQFAASLPMNMKIRKGQGKWILRQVLYKYVPKEMVERPKMGFTVPVPEWLRGPLKDWAKDLLSSSKIDQDGYLNSSAIDRVWSEHEAGTRDRSMVLWNALMFQTWKENFFSKN